jgi:hypothetical protein
MRNEPRFEHSRRRLIQTALSVGVVLGLALITGCPPVTPPTDGGTASGIYNNTTDRTNGGASYIGSLACKACHPSTAAEFRLHAHASALNKIQDGAPRYPDEATRAGGFEPPEGKEWSDVAFVIGGYLRKALFVDLNGFVMSDGVEGVNTQWNLEFPDNGTVAGFAAYEPNAVTPKPYDYSCFVCHTTGPAASDPNNPTFQENRPGMAGTFVEEGIQCESCHGPGSNHVPNPPARNIFVDTSAASCKECHINTFGSDDARIHAEGGFITVGQQWLELQASGGHSTFACTFCHDPHVSVNYDEEHALINDCTDCHTDLEATFHEDAVFVRGEYVEPVDCQSCHMPYATRVATAAAEDVVGPDGRMGDTRTHIFRITIADADYTTMFSDDGTEVLTDAQGRAAVTLDFVCLRCHNGLGNVTSFPLQSAAAIAASIHAN